MKIFYILIFAFLVKAAVSQPLSSEVMDFGTNPGNLSLFYYIPKSARPNAPLVLVLHGCSQGANAVAELTGWNKLADDYGFCVAYPQQHFPNNPSHCFNWFKKNEIERGNGECESIRQMIEYMQKKFSISKDSVFVTGLSAGAAMSVVMIATQPAMFKAAAIFAGGPYKPGNNIFTSSGTMVWGVNKTPEEWKELVWRENPAFKGPYPKVFIYHGNSDPVVNVRNAKELMEQWTCLHKADTVADQIDSTYMGKNDIMRLAYHNRDKQEAVVFYKINHMGHAIPIDPGACKNQGGKGGVFATDKGLYSTYHAAVEFGLIPQIKIEGNSEVNVSQKNIEFKAPMLKDYAYEWILPKGVEVNGEKNTNSILVNWNTKSGSVLLKMMAPDGCWYYAQPKQVIVSKP